MHAASRHALALFKQRKKHNWKLQVVFILVWCLPAKKSKISFLHPSYLFPHFRLAVFQDLTATYSSCQSLYGPYILAAGSYYAFLPSSTHSQTFSYTYYYNNSHVVYTHTHIERVNMWIERECCVLVQRTYMCGGTFFIAAGSPT